MAAEARSPHRSAPLRSSTTQKRHWARDGRVRVTHRPLRYRYERDESGIPVRDPQPGLKIPVVPPTDKGVAVMCALALLRHAQSPDVDLVILASLDSDLIPALDEVSSLGKRVETFSWWNPRMRGFEMHLSDPEKRVWNTRLNEQAFLRCLDTTNYT